MCFIIDDIIYAISAAIAVAAEAAPVIGAVGLGFDAASMIACAAGDGTLSGILGSVGGIFGAVSGVGGAFSSIVSGASALAEGAAQGVAEGAAEGVAGAAASGASTFETIYHGYQLASGLGQLGTMIAGNKQASMYMGGITGLLGGGFGALQSTSAFDTALAVGGVASSSAELGLEATGHDHEAALLGLGSGLLQSGLSLPEHIQQVATTADRYANPTPATVEFDAGGAITGDGISGPTAAVTPGSREAFFGPGVVSDETRAWMDGIAATFDADEARGSALAEQTFAGDRAEALVAGTATSGAGRPWFSEYGDELVAGPGGGPGAVESSASPDDFRRPRGWQGPIPPPPASMLEIADLASGAEFQPNAAGDKYTAPGGPDSPGTFSVEYSYRDGSWHLFHPGTEPLDTAASAAPAAPRQLAVDDQSPSTQSHPSRVTPSSLVPLPAPSPVEQEDYFFGSGRAPSLPPLPPPEEPARALPQVRVAFAEPPVKFYDSSSLVPPIETVTDARYPGDTFGTVDTYVRGAAASYANIGIAAVNASNFYGDAARHLLTHVGPFSDVDVDFFGNALVAPEHALAAIPGATHDFVAGIGAARDIGAADALAAAEAGAGRAGVQVGDYTLTETNAGHLTDVAKSGPFKGELERPYLSSPQTLQEIMSAGEPIPDPGGVPGALRWDVPGSFRGSSGTWELVVDPQSNTILHWLFRSSK